MSERICARGGRTLLVTKVVVYLVMCAPAVHARLAKTSHVYFTNACFGSVGLKQAANILECHQNPKLPRICIQNVWYGAKRPSRGSGCPTSGISSKVDPECCKSARSDCAVQADEAKENKTRMACSKQSMSRCVIQVDQMSDGTFIACTGSSRSSTFRTIDYICIVDSDTDAKGHECYAPRKIEPLPPITTRSAKTIIVTKPIATAVAHRPRPTTRSTTRLFDPRVTRRETSIRENTPIPLANVATSETAIPVPTTGRGATAKPSGLSQEQKIIVAVSVSVVGILLVVIVVAAVRTLIRRKQLNKKNTWLENNFNKNRLNNMNLEPRNGGDGDGGDVKANQNDAGEIYEEICETAAETVTSERTRLNATREGEGAVDPSDHVHPQNDQTSPNKVSRNQSDAQSSNEGRRAGVKNADMDPNMLEVKYIGNHKYQEVGLRPNNPLYKSAGYAPPAKSANIGYDEKTRKIVDKITNTDTINVFKKGSKYHKAGGRVGYDSDTATLRRVAMFVKKCIREIDITDRPRKASSKRHRRNSASEVQTRHKSSEKRARKQNNVVVKPWDFIHGSKSKQHSDTRDVVRKSSFKKAEHCHENGEAERRDRSYDTDLSGNSDESYSTDEEIVDCRFPVRRRSVMIRKKRKSGDTDSIPSTSGSGSDRSNPRNLEVRFQKKLTYIDSERGGKNGRRGGGKHLKRNDRHDDKEVKSSKRKDERKESAHRRKREDDGTKGDTPRRDSLVLHDKQISSSKSSKRRSSTAKSLRKKQSRDEVVDDVRRHSTHKRLRPKASYKGASSIRKHRPHVAPKPKAKRGSNRTFSRAAKSKEKRDADYDTDTEDSTDSDSTHMI